MKLTNRAFCLAAFALCAAYLPAQQLDSLIETFDECADGGLPAGWTIAQGDWQCMDGELAIKGAAGENWIWHDRPFSGDITIQFSMKFIERPPPDVGRHGGIAFFGSFPGEPMTRGQMSGYTLDWIDRGFDHGVRFIKWNNGAALPECEVLPCRLFTSDDPPIVWKVVVQDTILSFFMDDKLFYELEEPTYRDGYLGLWQWSNNLHTTYDDVLVNPKLVVRRDIPDDLQNGKSGTVQLVVSLNATGVVKVSEDLPPSLKPSNPSHGGILDGNSIKWDLGRIDKDVILSYTMEVAPDSGDVAIPGSATFDGEKFPIVGDDYTGSPFTVTGFIQLWNHLEPLAGANCDAGPDLPLDWIVNADGSINEQSIRPFPGLITRPKYGGDGVVPPAGTGARATGVVLRGTGTGSISTDRFPVWKGSLHRGDTIDHTSALVNGFDASNHMTMSYVYVYNNTNLPIDTSMGFSSDDSIQVQLNGTDVANMSICRGLGAEDVVPTVTLVPGENRLLVKVTDGTGPSGFRLRFHKDPLEPTLVGLLPPVITASLESKATPRLGDVVRDVSKDSIGLGETVDVTLSVSMKTASNVLVREVLPDHTQVSVILDSGTLTGNTIEWNLAQVTQKTLRYKLAVGPCAGDLVYGQSTFKTGSTEVVVSGKSTVSRTYRQDDLGAAWKSADIGAAGGGSVERLGDHQVLVNASGAGVKLLKDEFHFISVGQAGDFEVSARIGCFDDPGSKGVAGLMVRDSNEEGAPNAFLGLTSAPPAGAGVGTLRVSFRRDLNKTTTTVPATAIAAADKDVVQLPVYLKLVRTGDKLSFQRSDNGTSYREIFTKNATGDNTPIKLNLQALAGLAVTGGGAGSTRADFQEVSGPPFVSVVVAGFRRGDGDGSGTLDLTDAIGVLGRLFLGAAEPACLDAADADDSGVLDLTDAIYSLGWQFTGGPAPPPPGPTACGPDPSEDGFKPCVYESCAVKP